MATSSNSPALIDMEDDPASVAVTDVSGIIPPPSASLLQATTDDSGVITARSRTEWNEGKLWLARNRACSQRLDEGLVGSWRRFTDEKDVVQLTQGARS
eukprot:scaffold3917_cov377-Prasinococcus_capsulatus_cf.AAC.2